MLQRRRLIAFFAASFLAIPAAWLAAAQPIEIILTDNYVAPTYGVANLSGGAGTDFSSAAWESATNAVDLEVKRSAASWNITVRKVDSAWNASLILSVKRNTGGTGPGVLSGGTAYQQITGTDTQFFSGTDDKKSIPLQFSISGMTVTLGAATFITTVYYTVTEN